MKLVYTLLALVMLVSTVQAQSITTLQLRNRPAAEVIPIIEPLLGDGDRISGHGFKLFLRASPATVAQVEEMIAALDTAAKVLQISVYQGDSRGIRQLDMNAGIRLRSGDASIGAGSDNNNQTGGGNITFSGRDGSASIGGNSTRLRLQDDPIHQVRVSEGNTAYIETGAQIPYFSGSAWITPEATTGGIEYKNVTTGFYVLPRVSGDRVTLQVSPFRNSLSHSRGGDIATQSASTTLSGRLGEWLLIGGVSEQLRQSQSGIGSSTSTQSRNNSSIWIRADLIR